MLQNKEATAFPLASWHIGFTAFFSGGTQNVTNMLILNGKHYAHHIPVREYSESCKQVYILIKVINRKLTLTRKWRACEHGHCEIQSEVCETATGPAH